MNGNHLQKMSADAAKFIDQDRLWRRHMQMAEHGATANGGVNRQALSAEDVDARKMLIGWGAAIGLTAATDPAGNLFLRMAGTDPVADPVMTGSHLDSQPTGGKFDGVYGVLAGLEALEAIRAAGIRPRRSIDVVAWMNEEGSRFAPGMMGSSAFAGATPLEAILPVRDAAGVEVAEGLAAVRAALPDLPVRLLGGPVHAYIETHIEQGPLLERGGYTVGVVTGIQGKRTFAVTVTGEEAHAGTTSRRERKDALVAATAMVQAMNAALGDADDLVKFTVGRFEIKPNAPSVVPALARFSVDLRHPDSAALRALGNQVADLCATHRGPCLVNVVELSTAMSLAFPERMRECIRRHARLLRIPTIDILSSAGHDARYLHAICPTGMIFVPCRAGISHNEAESAEPEHLADGARVLVQTMLELAAED